MQQTLEEALSKIADQPIKLTAAGRTDAGVHATQQVVAFATPAERPDRAWTRGTNSLLPDTVSVRWALRFLRISTRDTALPAVAITTSFSKPSARRPSPGTT